MIFPESTAEGGKIKANRQLSSDLLIAVMKLFQAFSALTVLVLASQVPAVQAQSINECVTQASASADPLIQLTALGRAKNLARQAAEAANGGLANYRAAASMFGPISEAPCTLSGEGIWTFTFPGTAPGSNVPFVETTVSVNNQTWQVTVDSNKLLK